MDDRHSGARRFLRNLLPTQVTSVPITVTLDWIDWNAALNKRQWLFSTASGLEAFVDLTSVGCRLSLAEIYDKVEFQPELG